MFTTPPVERPNSGLVAAGLDLDLVDKLEGHPGRADPVRKLVMLRPLIW